MSDLQELSTVSGRPARIRRAITAVSAYRVNAATMTRDGISGHTQWRVVERSTQAIVFRSWYHSTAQAECERLIAHAVIEAALGK